MPELAEVEITRRQLLHWWQRKSAQDVEVLDDKLLSESSLEHLEALSSTLEDITRRGKYLVLCFEDGLFGVLHLRMTGRIAPSTNAKLKYTRFSVQMRDDFWICFEDSRRLGTLTLTDEDPLTHHPRLKTMGPEPHDIKDGHELKTLLGTTKRRLKDALLDQNIIAGVGNIAISELFFDVGIHPEVRAHEVSLDKLDLLVEAMPPYFDALIDAQPVDVPMEYINQGGDVENPFVVYDHEGEECPKCKSDTIERLTFGGRSTYYCPTCQPV